MILSSKRFSLHVTALVLSYKRFSARKFFCTGKVLSSERFPLVKLVRLYGND